MTSRITFAGLPGTAPHHRPGGHHPCELSWQLATPCSLSVPVCLCGICSCPSIWVSLIGTYFSASASASVVLPPRSGFYLWGSTQRMYVLRHDVRAFSLGFMHPSSAEWRYQAIYFEALLSQVQIVGTIEIRSLTTSCLRAGLSLRRWEGKERGAHQ